MDPVTLDKIEYDAVREILARFCRCSLGARVARHIRPSRNADVIRHWLDQTTQMVQAIRDVGLPPLGGVADVTDALARARPGGGGGPEDFAALASTLKAARAVKAYLLALPEPLDRLHQMGSGMGDFDAEIDAIEAVVAPDATIHDDASARLKRLRSEIEALARQIHDVIHGYLHQPDVRRLLQELTVTLHNDRYVLPVRTENRGRLPGVVHRTSGSGATVFVEPNACVELNNHLVDLRDDERAEVLRLLNELAMTIAPRADAITATLRAIARTDLIAAKAQYAYQFDMTCPELTEDGPLEFAQARHPLLIDQVWQQQQAHLPPEQRHQVVPIDVRLGLDFDILVITGSNTGGKTVCLKTVALLAMMAQSGMHIPARRGATMRIFQDVLIDVGDEQSLQQSLSTFGGHMQRLRHILAKADARCLVLLDELGAGTDPDEGGAIGQATLDELRRRKCLAMITTHLSVLKAYAFNHDRVDNASVEFDTETLSPTYHLRIGTPGESHAITVAEHIGLGPRLVKAARGHLSRQGQQFSKAIRATGVARRQAETARSEAQTAHLAAREQVESYERKLDELDNTRGDFETWLASLQHLKAGDEIHVPSLGKSARLVRLELHKQQAVVDSGSLQIEVRLRELMPDLGQSGVREQLEAMKTEIRQQLHDARAAGDQVRQVRQHYEKQLRALRRRDKQFTQWMADIRTLAVGRDVRINRRPGKATVVAIDLEHLQVTVKAGKEQMVLGLSDLFPQEGPFSAKADRRPGRKSDQAKPSQPMQHRKRSQQDTQANRRKLLEAEVGAEVFVVSFNRRAKLVRIDEAKDMAVVLSGNFELQVPLADIEPARPPQPHAGRDKGAPSEPPAPQSGSDQSSGDRS